MNAGRWAWTVCLVASASAGAETRRPPGVLRTCDSRAFEISEAVGISLAAGERLAAELPDSPAALKQQQRLLQDLPRLGWPDRVLVALHPLRAQEMVDVLRILWTVPESELFARDNPTLAEKRALLMVLKKRWWWQQHNVHLTTVQAWINKVRPSEIIERIVDHVQGIPAPLRRQGEVRETLSMLADQPLGPYNSDSTGWEKATSDLAKSSSYHAWRRWIAQRRASLHQEPSSPTRNAEQARLAILQSALDRPDSTAWRQELSDHLRLYGGTVFGPYVLDSVRYMNVLGMRRIEALVGWVTRVLLFTTTLELVASPLTSGGPKPIPSSPLPTLRSIQEDFPLKPFEQALPTVSPLTDQEIETLDRMLNSGEITVEEYVRRLPPSTPRRL